MSELISEELFDQFRSSDWPRQFSGMAQAACTKGVSIDELGSFPAYESGLIIAPKEELQMLEDMGIVEDHLSHRSPITPSMVKDMPVGIFISDFISESQDWIPRFSELGKQVIMACENLYTPEEHAAASEAAKPELERLIAEARAELGIEE
jgi:hypothetical protein